MRYLEKRGGRSEEIVRLNNAELWHLGLFLTLKHDPSSTPSSMIIKRPSQRTQYHQATIAVAAGDFSDMIVTSDVEASLC